MISKRFFSTTIDLFISAIPVYIVGSMSEVDIEMMVYKIVGFFVLHTSILLYFTKKTVGETLMKIKLVSIKNADIKFGVLFLRNLIFSLFLVLIVISQELLELIMALSLFLCLHLMIFVKNKYTHPMTGLDFFFKMHYKEC